MKYKVGSVWYDKNGNMAKVIAPYMMEINGRRECLNSNYTMSQDEYNRYINSDKINKDLLKNKLITQYNFEGFHHYTTFANFEKIYKSGVLYSRELVKQNSEFFDSAKKNIIDNTQNHILEYVRFFYKECTPTLFMNEGIKIDNEEPHMPIPVLLLFDENVMCHKKVLFSNGGCGNHSSIKTYDPEVAYNFEWDKIFSRGLLEENDEKAVLINHRNAEFLYYENISTDFLKKIIFRSRADLKHAEIIFGKNTLFEVNTQKFINHVERNYLEDYIINVENNKVNIRLKFSRCNIKDYVHEIIVEFADGRKAKSLIPLEAMKGNEICITYTDISNVNSVEYLLNGHVSAIWRN